MTPKQPAHYFDHPVQFYADTDGLMGELSEYVLGGFNQNETMLVVAREVHAAALQDILQDRYDLSAAKQRGQYVLMDAHETLAAFMVDDMPDQVRFVDVIGSLFVQLMDRGQPIRAFGEMVDILWGQGNHMAALRVEELWDEFAKSHRFSLFCAYRIEGLAGEGYDMPFHEIIDTHTRVILH